MMGYKTNGRGNSCSAVSASVMYLTVCAVSNSSILVFVCREGGHKTDLTERPDRKKGPNVDLFPKLQSVRFMSVSRLTVLILKSGGKCQDLAGDITTELTFSFHGHFTG